MLISVRHTTRYAYDAPARYAILSLRLKPPALTGQSVRSWTLTAPAIDKALHFTDGFGNAVSVVALNEEHTEIEIVAEGMVETADCAGVVRGLKEATPPRIYLRHTAPTKPDDAIRELAAGTSSEKGGLARLHELMDIIRARVAYETGTTSPLTTAAQVLEQGRGVCQDHAHVFIAAARSLGFPARYINGYFLSGATQPEAAHHAWAEAYVEHLGWVGFDVANSICPDDRYVRLAAGLDAATASPIRGCRPLPLGISHVEERLDVSVEVHQQQQQKMQQQ
jgi:transglutaminase-like putative cysteine protease